MYSKLCLVLLCPIKTGHQSYFNDYKILPKILFLEVVWNNEIEKYNGVFLFSVKIINSSFSTFSLKSVNLVFFVRTIFLVISSVAKIGLLNFFKIWYYVLTLNAKQGIQFWPQNIIFTFLARWSSYLNTNVSVNVFFLTISIIL